MSSRTAIRTPQPIHCRGRILERRRRPLVMGVLNVTPDSFSDGGAYLDPQAATDRARRMVDEGAEIIDIGGESTRPGADPVDVEDELARIMPVLERLRGEFPVPVSIDTRRARVAREALNAGCHMVNDITACSDPDMRAAVRDSGAAVVLMHMKGEPKSMQVNPSYDDPVREIKEFLHERAELLQSEGVGNERIIIDPGIGFGKRFQDNLDLLHAAGSFSALGFAVLIGASRKRFLGELLGEDITQRLSGSLAVAARCYQQQVDIVRVHDVKETVELFRVMDAMEHPRDCAPDR